MCRAVKSSARNGVEICEFPANCCKKGRNCLTGVNLIYFYAGRPVLKVKNALLKFLYCVMHCLVAWLAVTVAKARVQMLRCIWCIVGSYLRHRACLEHAKVQSASGHQHKSAVSVAIYAVFVVQICNAKCV